LKLGPRLEPGRFGLGIPEFRLGSPESGTEKTDMGAFELVAKSIVGFLRHIRRLGNHRSPLTGLQLAHESVVIALVALDLRQPPGFQVCRLAGLEARSVRRKIKYSHLTPDIGAGELPLPTLAGVP
jgi:hypothetical protein